MPSLGGWEWVILALIALLLFGGSRLAGIGKNAGRAIRDFKDETSSLRSGATTAEPAPPVTPAAPANPGGAAPSPSPVDPDAETGRS